MWYILIRRSHGALSLKGKVAMFIKANNKEIQVPFNTKVDSVIPEDRRYLPRWEVNNKILYQKEDELISRECLSKDINAIGACIRTSDDIKPDQKLNLTIYLADDIEPVHVHGKAMWRLNGTNENFIGIQFDAVNDKTGELIYNYAFEYKKDQLFKNWFKGS